jgi:hypothetical protein
VVTFRRSFEKKLPLMTSTEPGALMRKARGTHWEILTNIPEFDKDDRFLVNILSAAMLAAVYLNLPERPEPGAVTAYYHSAMTETRVMRLFMKKHDSYSAKARGKLARQAEASQRRRNPYSWRFRYEAGPAPNSYSAYFDTCGILRLMERLGIPEIMPAMCSYDYDMAELAGSIFTREHTLAGGGPCCDCHYQKRS